jgi:hypothetical protein
MQTFLPYPSAAHSAACLDRQRLGKQRVEALQILHTLQGKSSGWAHHPAVLMWRGYEYALALYGWAVCDEWLQRGYRDTCLVQFVEAMAGRDPESAIVPPWIGDEAFHLSHQSNLVRKFPEHYRPFFPDVPDDLPYVWPKEVTPTA